jgi:hypothetical protein
MGGIVCTKSFEIHESQNVFAEKPMSAGGLVLGPTEAFEVLWGAGATLLKKL